MGEGEKTSSRRIVSAGAEWMTFADPLHRFPSTSHRSVFIDRIHRILAARRLKAALAAPEAAQGGAIDQDELDQKPSHEVFCALV